MKKTNKLKTLIPGFEKIKQVQNISEYQLKKNGLTVLLVSLPKSETVTTNIVYGVGSRNEKTGETGLSHMLEHMLFMKTHTKSKTWKDLESEGAVYNANTSLDRTSYFFNLPSSYLDTMLEVEADRMRNLIIRDSEFLPERANVQSEYEMIYSDPLRALESKVMEVAFLEHGYHHDTIGFKNDIASYTSSQLKDFYDRYYDPCNATLIIVGPQDDTMTLKKVKEKFGNIVSRKQRYEDHRRESAQEGTRRIILERHTPVRGAHFAFKAPPFSSREWSALELALKYLADGEVSVLHKKMVDTHLATQVRAHIYPTKDPFLAFFEIVATEKTPYEQLERILTDSITHLQNSEISEDNLSLIKEYTYSTELFSRDGSYNISDILTEYVASGSWERYFTQLEELKSITATEIKDAVKKYLSIRCLTIGTLEKPSTI